jgi:hypothetical protein
LRSAAAPGSSGTTASTIEHTHQIDLDQVTRNLAIRLPNAWRRALAASTRSTHPLRAQGREQRRPSVGRVTSSGSTSLTDWGKLHRAQAPRAARRHHHARAARERKRAHHTDALTGADDPNPALVPVTISRFSGIRVNRAGGRRHNLAQPHANLLITGD